MMKKVSKMIGNTVLVVSTLLGVWLLASWVDVVTHNLNPNPIYQSWNLFALMVGYHQQVIPYSYVGSLAYAHGRELPKLRENTCSHKKNNKKTLKKIINFFPKTIDKQHDQWYTIIKLRERGKQNDNIRNRRNRSRHHHNRSKRSNHRSMY